VGIVCSAAGPFCLRPLLESQDSGVIGSLKSRPGSIKLFRNAGRQRVIPSGVVGQFEIHFIFWGFPR